MIIHFIDSIDPHTKNITIMVFVACDFWNVTNDINPLLPIKVLLQIAKLVKKLTRIKICKLGQIEKALA